MAEQVNDNKKFTGSRLPASLKATHYDLTLKPDFDKFAFEGEVKIDYEHSSPADGVVIHALELEIHGGYSEDKLGANRRALKKVTYSEASEAASLEFENNCHAQGVICLEFKGTINDKLRGFYRTAIKIGGTTVYGGITQFAATDARRCFPCFDEPAAKATFTFTMIHKQSVVAGGQHYPLVCQSNMPIESSQMKADETVVKFQKSPIMSTYLLAFVLGPFEFIEGSDGRRPIRLFTTPGKKEQGQYALEIACKSLTYYEDYFDVKYPLPKMDMVAVPDFSYGAMENWGLVMYREDCLLNDALNTSTDRKQYIAIIVAHELSHQWFGNLVTMEWWTHLWLNEGFASFMQYLCVDSIFPDYQVWYQFVTDAYGRALDLDSLNSSHPIEVPVNNSGEINEIFDLISYSKGASVIRMLYNFIGDDSFRRGMKDYLTKFAYSNATTEDLWDALEAASKKPVRQLMSGWTSQKGYPWLSITCTQDGTKAKLKLRQSKFTADGKLPADDMNAKWMIPISAVTSSNSRCPVEVCLLEKEEAEVTVDVVEDGWLKLNPGTIGLYRSAYSEDMIEKLIPAISDLSLPPMDRLGVQNDFFALCRAGKVKTVELLKLLKAFKNETNFTVWNSIDSCVGRLSCLLSPTNFQAKYHAYGKDIYKGIFTKLGWTAKQDEKDSDALTRSLVINRLVSFGEQEVVDEAMRRFQAHLTKTEIIPADLRGAIYKAVSAYGDNESFESLLNICKTGETQEERNRAARALGYAKDPNRLQRVVMFILSEDIRNQDKVFVIAILGASNPSAAFKFVQDHKDFLRKTYEGGILISRVLKASIENLSSEEMAQEVEKFFDENKFDGAERSIQQALETIRVNIDWLARDSSAIEAYLA